jgi:hypothetical protein
MTRGRRSDYDKRERAAETKHASAYRKVVFRRDVAIRRTIRNRPWNPKVNEWLVPEITVETLISLRRETLTKRIKLAPLNV